MSVADVIGLSGSGVNAAEPSTPFKSFPQNAGIFADSAPIIRLLESASFNGLATVCGGTMSRSVLQPPPGRSLKLAALDPQTFPSAGFMTAAAALLGLADQLQRLDVSENKKARKREPVNRSASTTLRHHDESYGRFLKLGQRSHIHAMRFISCNQAVGNQFGAGNQRPLHGM